MSEKLTNAELREAADERARERYCDAEDKARAIFEGTLRDLEIELKQDYKLNAERYPTEED